MFSKRLAVFNRNILYAVIFSAFFGPAFFVLEFAGFHLFAFRLLWLLLMVSGLLYLALHRAALTGEVKSVKTYLIFLTAWLIYSLLSLIWAAHTADAIRQTIFLLMGLSLVFFVVIFFRELKDYLNLQAIWVITLAIIIIIGLWNLISGQQLESSAFAGQIIHIPTSVFHYQNDLATHLVLSIPFLTAYLQYDSRLAVRVFSVILLTITFTLLMATGSRINLVALLVGAAFWFILLADKKMRIKAAIVLIVTITVVLALSFLLAGDMLGLNDNYLWGFNRLADFIANLSSMFTEGILVTDVSIDSRLNIFKNGILFIIESYGFGVGAGNADYYMENYSYYNTFGFFNPHNWWLEIAVNYGVIIFIAFLCYYFSLLISLFKFRGKTADISEKMVAEALLLSLVIFFFASMSSSSLFGTGSVWVLFALATGFVNTFRSKV